jgi:signal peptidase I
MYPSLKDKQILIAIRTNNVNKNDVVVAYVEDSYIIKRVAYVAGDEIFYLFTNNSEIPIIINKELYEKHKKNEKTASVQKIKIDKDKVFLLGDNSELSDDSRRFGCLNTDTIKYKIILPRL